MADPARGHRLFETDVAEVALLSVGPPGDLAHSATQRARASWTGSARPSTGTSGGVSPIDHLDQTAGVTLGWPALAAGSWRIPRLGLKWSVRIPPPTTRAERFWQLHSAAPAGRRRAAPPTEVLRPTVRRNHPSGPGGSSVTQPIPRSLLRRPQPRPRGLASPATAITASTTTERTQV